MDQIQGLDELSRRVLDKGLCASCGACVGRCPYVTSFKGRTVVLHECTLEQGRCFAYCPMTFFDPEATSMMVFGSPTAASRIGHHKEVRASRASDRSVAELGQGGGTVTSLMIAAMDSGLIDCAVLTGSFPGEAVSRGFVATTTEEILACSGSKFVGSHSLAALREALDRGFRHIGVVALPCQVRSLRKMALYDLKQEGLKERIGPVVGLFCNWAFSAQDFTTFLDKELDHQHVNRVHIPPPPAEILEVHTQGNVVTIPLDRVRPMIQAACHQCPDMTAEFSDMSVGMYEGKQGWNTLISRTATGARLLADAVDNKHLDVDVFPSDNLEHLKCASQNKRGRAAKNS
jgi:coenzyme F420 hydrogenase subunit beta